MDTRRELSRDSQSRIRRWANGQSVEGNRMFFGDSVFSRAERAWRELSPAVLGPEERFVGKVLEAMDECLEMARQSASCVCLPALAIHLCFANQWRRTGGRPWLVEVLERDGEDPWEDFEGPWSGPEVHLRSIRREETTRAMKIQERRRQAANARRSHGGSCASLVRGNLSLG